MDGGSPTASDTAAASITGATCGLCGKQIVPDYSARPDTYVHRDTGDEDCATATAATDLPPLPTDLDAWHATVRLYRIPDYLRAKADDLDRRMNGDRSVPRDPRSVADILAHLNDPSPEQLRARVARLRAESARLASLATEVEERLHGT